jgi:hypothetical protein
VSIRCSPWPRICKTSADALFPQLADRQNADFGSALQGVTGMNEQDWLTWADPTPMLEFLQGLYGDSVSARSDPRGQGVAGSLSQKAARRKLRLFACACVRRLRAVVSPDRIQAVRISEQYADGLASQTELEAALEQVRSLPNVIPWDADMALSVFGPSNLSWERLLAELILGLGPNLDARVVAKQAIEIAAYAKAAPHKRAGEKRQQAHLLRDIFGNPFRPVALDARLGARTRALARIIYQEGRFTDLPLLADALKQDAGCANQELRDHCQRPSRHVRGCWALDLMLESP